jgi:uncharacterized protein YcbX
MYVYPIKSLRPTPVDKSMVLTTGFQYDRRFMLLKVEKGDEGVRKLKNMAVSTFAEMTLFLTSINYPVHGKDGEIIVTFSPPNAGKKTITIPLEPDTSSLSSLDVTMHGSYTKAYGMEAQYNEWFSECFGFPVVFAYLGEHLRPVLFQSTKQQLMKPSWFSGITKNIPLLGGYLEEDLKITFADCAPFLVVTEDSLHDVSARLPVGELMDVTKYRPNIVLAGADQPWDEDFWAEIQVGQDGAVQIPLQHNCIRCKSINIDYATGKPGKGKSGEVLKLMQKDRRVDKVVKYSPVFGRYGFLSASSHGKEIAIGDEVFVSKRNEERTGFGKLSLFNISRTRAYTNFYQIGPVCEPLYVKSLKQLVRKFTLC